MLCCVMKLNLFGVPDIIVSKDIFFLIRTFESERLIGNLENRQGLKNERRKLFCTPRNRMFR